MNDELCGKPTTIKRPSRQKPMPPYPACWDWPLPPLPQPNRFYAVVRDWQAGRCAICGEHRPGYNGLEHDHDHATGDSRGYLCRRCNSMEGRSNALEVFVHYRVRNPATMLGMLDSYKRDRHPAIVQAEDELGRAFGQVVRDDRAEWSPLAVALDRVGLTGYEWEERQEQRRIHMHRPHAHLPTETDPPMELCNPGRLWIPVGQNYGRRLCAGCYNIDPKRATALVGDGYGPRLDYARDRIEAANRYRVAPTPLAPMI